MAELTCPPLGTGSVDFNAVDAAARKAKTVDEIAAAIANATAGGVPDRIEVEQPALTPAPVPEANPAADALASDD